MVAYSTPLEVRVAGRTLSGAAIPYGERARDRAEMFRPGSVELLEPVTLNLQHDPERRIASTADGTLRIADGPDALRLEADLREGSAELALVRRGALTGLSGEFYAIRETRSAEGLRVIERAAVPAFGLVDRGSYRTSVELRAATLALAEPRALSGRTLTADIPADVDVACECSGPGCRFARMMADGLQEALDECFDELRSEIIATWANYSQPLASVSKGTLRRHGATGVAIDLPDDDYGRAVIAADESAGVVVRPYLDPVDSQATVEGEVMVYSAPVIRAFVVSSTDKRQGWPEPRIAPTPEQRSTRRRLWL